MWFSLGGHVQDCVVSTKLEYQRAVNDLAFSLKIHFHSMAYSSLVSHDNTKIFLIWKSYQMFKLKLMKQFSLGPSITYVQPEELGFFTDCRLQSTSHVVPIK